MLLQYDVTHTDTLNLATVSAPVQVKFSVKMRGYSLQMYVGVKNRHPSHLSLLFLVWWGRKSNPSSSSPTFSLTEELAIMRTKINSITCARHHDLYRCCLLQNIAYKVTLLHESVYTSYSSCGITSGSLISCSGDFFTYCSLLC